MHEEQYEGAFWYAVAAGLLLTAAAALRIRFLGQTLFEDEIWVARLIQHGGLAPHTFSTPPLFYEIGRLWASVRGTSDAALREAPAFFGVAICAVAFAAPRPLRTRFTWAVLLAFSSPILFYSTRVKQYPLEAFVGAALIVLFLRAYERESLAAWIGFFALAACGVLTLHTPVFIVAAAGAVVLFTKRVRNAPLIGGFIAIGALAVFAYLSYLAPGPTTASLHGDMDVFFTETGRWVTSAASFYRDTKEWTGQAMNLVPLWWLVAAPLVVIWLIVRRDFAVFALAALPPLAIVAASIVHKYPYGETRLMIFCFPAFYLVIADALATASRRVPLLLLVLVPFIVAGAARDPYNSTYMRVSDVREVITVIAANHHPGEAIHADPSYASVLGYYLPQLKNDVRAEVVASPSGPGWYLQRTARFQPGTAMIFTRNRDLIVAHQ